MKPKIIKNVLENDQEVAEDYRKTPQGTSLKQLLNQAFIKSFYQNNQKLISDWSEEDYDKFISALKLMDINLYEYMYPYLNDLMLKSKKDMEQELRKLDFILETHVFDPEKITVFTEATDQEPASKKQIFKEHQFYCSDMIQFIVSTSSKILQLGTISFSNFKSKILQLENSEEQIEYLKWLLNLIYQHDAKILNSTLEPYHQWISRIISYPKLYSLLKSQETRALTTFKEQIFSMLKQIEQQRRKPIDDHNKDLFARINAYQIKKSS